jgi:hypothetical protein
VGAASESNEREEYKGEVDDVCTWEEKTKEENKRRGSSEVEGGQDDSRCRMTVHDAGTGVWTWATAVNEVRSYFGLHDAWLPRMYPPATNLRGGYLQRATALDETGRHEFLVHFDCVKGISTTNQGA